MKYGNGMRTSHRLRRVAMALLLMVGMLGAWAFGPSETMSRAYAATDISQSGVKFGIKNGTPFQLKMWYAGAGKMSYEGKITGLTIKNATKKGYRTATLTVTITRKWNPTKSQVVSMVKQSEKLYQQMTSKSGFDGNLVDGGIGFFVVDFTTGRNLEAAVNAKKYGVTVKAGRMQYKNSQTYQSGSYWVRLPRQIVRTYTITFPNSYKGLTFGVGTGMVCYRPKAVAKLDAGKVLYTKSYWHYNSKAATRFMRIGK